MKRAIRVILIMSVCVGAVLAQTADRDRGEAVAFARQPIAFSSYVFSGDRFPDVAFVEPLLAERRIGPYTIDAVFYDRDYQLAPAPARTGRYGAVVTIRATASGRTYRRFRTVFRTPSPVDWTSGEVIALLDLPASAGIDAVVMEEQRGAISHYLKRQLVRGLREDEVSGALFAGLQESVPGTGRADVANAYRARDRAWWTGLKRRLYAMPVVEVLDCPTAVYRGRATELVMGSPSEAGMRGTVTADLDSVAKGWLEATDEPFSVCFARNGVVFYYRAFGSLGRGPTTLATPAPLSTVTQLIATTALMTLVDQKRVGWDTPVSGYLPALRGTALEGRLTVRQLVDGTSGLDSDWGDDDNDLGELIGGLADHVSAPSMGAAGTGGANGTAWALVGKVIEAASGEPLDQFYRDHLLDPLGCEGTTIFGTHADATSVPLDLARLGQLLLNWGSYGDFLYFEPETAIAMQEEEVGTRRISGEGLGPDAFGNTSETALLRADPTNKLVIVIQRLRSSDDAFPLRSLIKILIDHMDPS